MTVRDAADGHLQGNLATFKAPDPKSVPWQRERALIGPLSRVIGRLPEVTGTPALRVNGSVEELM